MDKISVIVPIYNGEEYLKECVDSLLSQTYKNVEIILVNDGSIDNTKNICEDYVKKYSNIKLFNIQNSGSSSARKYGIKKSSGKYISFVDCDDFIENDMLELLHDNVISYKVDIAMCGHYIYYDENTKDIVHGDGSINVYDKLEATKLILLDDKINSFLCDKLFKRDLLISFDFPNLSYHEDFASVYNIIYNSNGIVVNNTPKYYYRRNLSSKSFNINYKKKYDSFLAYLSRYNFIISHFAELRPCFDSNLSGLINAGISTINLIIRDAADFDESDRIKNIIFVIRSNLFQILKQSDVSLKNKILSLLSCNFNVYKRIICLNKCKLTQYNIIYISAFPYDYFNKIIKNTKIGSQWCSQKFNRLLIEGLSSTSNLEVLITEDPLRHQNTKIYSKSNVVFENDIKYTFLPIVKVRFFGKLVANMFARKYVRKNKKYNMQNVLVFDILKPNIYNTVKYCKKKNYKIISLVTDLPMFFSNRDSLSFINKYIACRTNLQMKYIQNNTDGYIFVTDNMKEKINCRNRRYIVIEGISDFVNAENLNVKRKNIIMYTGDLSKLYGVDKLIKAFIQSKLENYELHLYGKCDYLEELKEICDKYQNIKYFGIIPNNEIMQKQINAKLLVNPRPLKNDFNKYSFPSKIMEYMSSGTPVLTTKLQGIPNEYDTYLNYMIGDSIEQIKNSLEKIFEEDYDELLHKAAMARQFVLDKKNKYVQSKKIIDLLK